MVKWLTAVAFTCLLLLHKLSHFSPWELQWRAQSDLLFVQRWQQCLSDVACVLYLSKWFTCLLHQGHIVGTSACHYEVLNLFPLCLDAHMGHTKDALRSCSRVNLQTFLPLRFLASLGAAIILPHGTISLTWACCMFGVEINQCRSAVGQQWAASSGLSCEAEWEATCSRSKVQPWGQNLEILWLKFVLVRVNLKKGGTMFQKFAQGLLTGYVIVIVNHRHP